MRVLATSHDGNGESWAAQRRLMGLSDRDAQAPAALSGRSARECSGIKAFQKCAAQIGPRKSAWAGTTPGVGGPPPPNPAFGGGGRCPPPPR
jgi:hypothetical protein